MDPEREKKEYIDYDDPSVNQQLQMKKKLQTQGYSGLKEKS